MHIKTFRTGPGTDKTLSDVPLKNGWINTHGVRIISVEYFKIPDTKVKFSLSLITNAAAERIIWLIYTLVILASGGG